MRATFHTLREQGAFMGSLRWLVRLADTDTGDGGKAASMTGATLSRVALNMQLTFSDARYGISHAEAHFAYPVWSALAWLLRM